MNHGPSLKTLELWAETWRFPNYVLIDLNAPVSHLAAFLPKFYLSIPHLSTRSSANWRPSREYSANLNISSSRYLIEYFLVFA